jgi:hypothetical protein
MAKLWVLGVVKEKNLDTSFNTLSLFCCCGKIAVTQNVPHEAFLKLHFSGIKYIDTATIARVSSWISAATARSTLTPCFHPWPWQPPFHLLSQGFH